MLSTRLCSHSTPTSSPSNSSLHERFSSKAEPTSSLTANPSLLGDSSTRNTRSFMKEDLQVNGSQCRTKVVQQMKCRELDVSSVNLSFNPHQGKAHSETSTVNNELQSATSNLSMIHSNSNSSHSKDSSLASRAGKKNNSVPPLRIDGNFNNPTLQNFAELSSASDSNSQPVALTSDRSFLGRLKNVFGTSRPRQKNASQNNTLNHVGRRFSSLFSPRLNRCSADPSNKDSAKSSNEFTPSITSIAPDTQEIPKTPVASEDLVAPETPIKTFAKSSVDLPSEISYTRTTLRRNTEPIQTAHDSSSYPKVYLPPLNFGELKMEQDVEIMPTPIHPESPKLDPRTRVSFHTEPSTPSVDSLNRVSYQSSPSVAGGGTKYESNTNTGQTEEHSPTLSDASKTSYRRSILHYGSREKLKDGLELTGRTESQSTTYLKRRVRFGDSNVNDVTVSVREIESRVINTFDSSESESETREEKDVPPRMRRNRKSMRPSDQKRSQQVNNQRSITIDDGVSFAGPLEESVCLDIDAFH